MQFVFLQINHLIVLQMALTLILVSKHTFDPSYVKWKVL